ncbi:protein of unknown function (plasmid) [Pararobbsia alpina]
MGERKATRKGLDARPDFFSWADIAVPGSTRTLVINRPPPVDSGGDGHSSGGYAALI